MAVDIHRLVNFQDSPSSDEDFKKVISQKAEKLFNLKDVFDPEYQNYDFPVKNLNPELTIAASMTLPRDSEITKEDMNNLDSFISRHHKIFSKPRSDSSEPIEVITYVSDGRSRRTKEQKQEQRRQDAIATENANNVLAKLKIIRYWKFMKIIHS